MALSAEQIARLTSDIVWMVEQTVSLEDGSSAQVLVPQVYVRVLPGDINGNGALLSGRVSELNINENLNNSGTVAGRQALRIDASTVDNINGRISANNIAIEALENINNVDGTIDAANTLLLQAGRDINNVTTTTTNTNAQGSVTNLNRVAGIYITGAENGVLLAQAGNNINIDAAQLINQSVGGQTLLKAGNDINIGTTTISRHQENRLDADNYIIRGNQTDIGSNIQTSGDLSLVAGRDINAKAAQVNSSLGQLDVLAGRDVNLSTGNHYTLIDDGSKHTGRSGGGNKQVETSKIHINDQQTLASDFGGNVINVQAGNDVNVIGSSIISDSLTNVSAGRNVNILAAEEHNQTDSFYSKKKSGLMSSGGIGFTVGSVKETTENTSENVRHAASTVGSLQGDTNIIAQEKYTQTGSIVSSPEGTVNIVAKQVDIEAAKDQYASDYKHTFEQKGFTVAVNIPVVNAVQGAVSAIQSFDKIGDSKNDRVNAMAAANSAWGTYKAGQGLADIANDPKAAASQDVSVSITYGEQKNVDQTKTQGTLASASQINAGNQVNIVATGAGKDSNINIIGSDVAGKGGTNLYADNEVNIKSTEQVHQERSENKSEGWNAGVAISYGQGGFAFGVTAGGNYGKGYGNGDEVTYRNSHVGDENSKTSIISGGVTTIAGGQVVGKSVHLDAAALNIESQQDTLKFEGEQQNIEGQITVGYGASGSASYSQSEVNADYASVREQSGIFAGDDGYQISVKEQTHLKGGLITSTKAAEDAGKNYFSTGSIVVEDIQNHANYDASGFGIGGSASFNANLGLGEHAKAQGDAKNDKGQLLTGKDSVQANRSIGFGSDSGSDASVTYAGINTKNITITDAAAQKALTGQNIEDAKAAAHLAINSEDKDQASGLLANNFDKEAVQKEINLQVAVTKQFSANTQVVIADLDKAIENKKQAGQDTTNLENASRLLKVVSAGLLAPTDSVLGMAAAAASPEVAREIGQYFKENAELNKIDGGNRAEQGSAAHILAHTVLGAAVAAAGGNDALTAGLAAGGAEAVAPVVSNWLYGTSNPEELTTEQKATISSIAGLAGAGVGGISGGSVSDVVAGSQVAQNAIDNNLLINKLGEEKLNTNALKLLNEKLKKLGVQSADDYYKRMNQCTTDACRKQVLSEYQKASDLAGRLILSAFNSGQISQSEVDILVSGYANAMMRGSGASESITRKDNDTIYTLDGASWTPAGIASNPYLNELVVRNVLNKLTKEGASQEKIETTLEQYSVASAWLASNSIDTQAAIIAGATNLSATAIVGIITKNRGGKALTQSEIAAIQRISKNKKAQVHNTKNTYLYANAEKISTANKAKNQSSSPRDLNEKLAFESVKSNPKQGKNLIGMNNDPRFPHSAGFQKMEAKFKLSNGETITIHYQYNSVTNRTYDVKVTSPQRNLPNPNQPFVDIRNNQKWK